MNCSGLPHLAISNSTPPPSAQPASPLSVKVKSEPVSPPRGDHGNHHLPHSQQAHTVSYHNVGSNGLGAISITSGSGGSGAGSVLGSSAGVNHVPQQHLIINSRPNSTGHLTPTPGESEIPRIFCGNFSSPFSLCLFRRQAQSRQLISRHRTCGCTVATAITVQRVIIV